MMPHTPRDFSSGGTARSVGAGGGVTLRVLPLLEGLTALPVDFTDVGSADFEARVRRGVARVEVLLPDGSVERAEPEDDGSFTLTFRAPSGAGAYAVDVVALDAAGNATRATRTLTVRPAEGS